MWAATRFDVEALRWMWAGHRDEPAACFFLRHTPVANLMTFAAKWFALVAASLVAAILIAWAG